MEQKHGDRSRIENIADELNMIFRFAPLWYTLLACKLQETVIADEYWYGCDG